MRRKKQTAAVEILKPSERGLVPPGQSLQAMIAQVVQEQVREQVAEILRTGTLELEPDMQSREVATALMRRQDVFDRRKWAMYYAKHGCRRCDTKKKPHGCLGYCDKCRNLFQQRILQIRFEWDREHPDRQADQQTEALTRRVRSAQRLLANGG